jgi:RHS repeat-associated protein
MLYNTFNLKNAGRARAAYLYLFCIVAAFYSSAYSQTQTPTDGYTPTGLQQGAPVGSYPLSGFDNINLFNRHLNFTLPLAVAKGRGEVGHTVALPINQGWEIGVSYDSTFGEYRSALSRGYGVPLYGPGVVKGVRGTSQFDSNMNCQSTTYPANLLTRIFFISPDGAETILFDEKYHGAQKYIERCSQQPAPANRGRVFRSGDGGSMTFISDSDIFDQVVAYHLEFPVSGVLLLADGTRYRVENNNIVWKRDRNGNKITFTYISGTDRVSVITDSLNRQITISYAPSVNSYDSITYVGAGGASRTIKVHYKYMSQALRPDYSIQTGAQLFPEIYNFNPYPYIGSWQHDPPVISEIELPGPPANPLKYKLYYNSYGELARVILPTGGGYDYDYLPPGQSGVSTITINRPLTKRTIYNTLTSTTSPSSPPAGTVEKREIFSSTTASPGVAVTVEHRNASNTLQSSQIHYYFGIPTYSSHTPTDYSQWQDGREYKTENLNISGGAAGSALQRTEQTWYPNPYATYCSCPAPDPKITESTTSLLDSNQVQKKSFSYDQYNNQTEVYEYDWGYGGPGSLLRHSYTGYLTSGYDEVVGGINAPDPANTIHIRNLPTIKQVYNVYNGSDIEIARTTFEYDEYYSQQGPHNALISRPSISGMCDGSSLNCPNGPNFTDPSFIKRGNVTKIARWLDIPNTSNDQESSVFQQYDVAGNVVVAYDANLNATAIDYSDRFGSPDDDARQNTPTSPNWLNGQVTYAFPTKVTNALSHISYTQYDYFLGRSVNSEDVNGIVSSVAYNDALDRPTQGIQARYKVGVGVTSAKSQTTIAYDDGNRVITTTSDRDVFNDNILTRKSYYDGLGRTGRAAVYEGNNSWSISLTNFDSLGRVSQASNPFQDASPGSGSAPSGTWTQTDYDAIGRVIKVTSPDTAHVDTNYYGNQTTVTDQAGKKRRSETDALGRLSYVTEDPGPGGLNYVTWYLYDAMNNLIYVNQGSQGRWFSYDSLSRLVRVRNIEQGINYGLDPHVDPITGGSGWSIAYSYDANGNLTKRIDARGVVSDYRYDALNRNTEIDHTNGADVTQIRRFYDSSPSVNGIGRLSFDWNKRGSNYITQNVYDYYDPLGRPLTKRQFFGNGGSWHPSYYYYDQSYNLAGAVKTQTYPSLRSTSYSYDSAGRLTGFSGALGDGVSRTYSTITKYNAAGQRERESYGTGANGMTTPLYLKLHYNKRMQMVDLRLGSVNDEWDLNRGAIILYYGQTAATNQNPFYDDSANNGNLVRQWTYVPKPAGGTVTPQLADYYYDQLNRLSSFTEGQINDSGTYVPNVASQTFSYDPYGNRKVTAASGGVSNFNPTYDTSSNRIIGLGYDNAGNITSDPAIGGTLTYDPENRLLTSGSSGASYAYDADGRRVKRTLAGGQEWWYIYSLNGELIAEYLSSAQTTVKKEYGYRNGQLLVVWNGDESTADKKLKWLIQDHLGSTRMELDKSGSLAGVTRRDHAPFGEEMTAGIRSSGHGFVASAVRQRFGSKERDNETGLDYFGARYYASVQGRFTSPDPFEFWMLNKKQQDTYITNPQRWNRYAYVLNNPLRYTDPNGLAEIPVWDSLDKSLRKDLERRGLNKSAWNGWDNDKRQAILNTRASLMAAGVWGSVKSIGFAHINVEYETKISTVTGSTTGATGTYQSVKGVAVTPDNKNGWAVVFNSDKDIRSDLESAGFYSESPIWNHPEGAWTYKQKGDDIILHVIGIKGMTDMQAGHYDTGGGSIFSLKHFGEYLSGRAGASQDDITRSLGGTSAAQHLRGITPAIDRLLVQGQKQ